MERSLRSAQERAVTRSERFIEAGTALLLQTGSLDFTVSELVEKSGLSLRAFYQHFASKDDLLLAVLEESIRAFVDSIRAGIDAEADPVERLRLYVSAFFSAGAGPHRDASVALSRYMLAVTSDRPAELSQVLGPQVRLLGEIVEAGVAAGLFRTDVPVPALVLLLTETLTSAVELDVLGAELTGRRVTVEDVWGFCRAAVVGDRR